MTEYKELFGGHYLRNNGRWYWKANETADPVLVMSGNLAKKIQEFKNKKPVSSAPAPMVTPVVAVVEKKEENFSPLPQVKKPISPKKKKEETTKTEVKVEEIKNELS
jgi:hypothetical protein